MQTTKLLAAISAVAISAGAGQASAQEVQPGIFKVAKGASQKIDRHGVCRLIKNSGANPVMIATGSREQWASGNGSFLSNWRNIPGLEVTACSTPDGTFYSDDRMYYFDEWWVGSEPESYTIAFVWDDPNIFQNSQLYMVGKGNVSTLSVGIDIDKSGNRTVVDGVHTNTPWSSWWTPGFSYSLSWTSSSGSPVSGTISFTSDRKARLTVGNCTWTEGAKKAGNSATGEPDLHEIIKSCS